jgi:hypothetical protein
MISDILTAIIVFLMAVLILYPTTRVLLRGSPAPLRRVSRKSASRYLRPLPPSRRVPARQRFPSG